VPAKQVRKVEKAPRAKKEVARVVQVARVGVLEKPVVRAAKEWMHATPTPKFR
jgi:hypothetical protein